MGQGVGVAIFSFSHSPVGRSTHAEGTAGAHISYISRGGACPSIGSGGGMSSNAKEVQAYLNEQEVTKDRKNARVIDKLMFAMPRELTPEQRYELAHDYGKEVTQGKAMYFFAMHETGKDASNPHCHMVIRDRNKETGAYVMKFSDSPADWKNRGMNENSPTEYLRERWEYKANEALEKAGHEVRIDRRSLTAQRDEALQRGDMLRAQELDRKAQIHVGVRAQKMAEKGIRPESNDNYKHIDKGRTRAEYNAEIINLNQEKQLRSRDVSIRTRALFEKEQDRIERGLKERHETTRKEHERQESDTRTHHRKILQQLGKDRNAYAEKQQGKAHAEGRKARILLENTQKQERDKQRLEQGRFFARMKRLIDFTGKTTQKDKHAIKELSQQQQGALKALEQKHAREAEKVRQNAIESHSDKINTALAERDKALNDLERQKEQLEQRVQAEFQKRAIDRHHGKEALEIHIKEQEKQAKAQERERAKARETADKQKDTERQRQPVKSLKQRREEEQAKRPHAKGLRQRLDAQRDKDRQRQENLNRIRQTGRERMQEQRRQQKPEQTPEHKRQEVQAVPQHFRAVTEQDNTARQAQEWHHRQHQDRQTQAEGIQQKSRQQEQQRQQTETQYHAPQHTPSTPIQKDFARQQRAQEITQELQQARETPQPNRQREIEI